jgi:hypothetical protein
MDFSKAATFSTRKTSFVLNSTPATKTQSQPASASCFSFRRFCTEERNEAYLLTIKASHPRRSDCKTFGTMKLKFGLFGSLWAKCLLTTKVQRTSEILSTWHRCKTCGPGRLRKAYLRDFLRIDGDEPALHVGQLCQMWNQVIAHRHVHLHEAEHNSLQKEVDRAVKNEVDANRDLDRPRPWEIYSSFLRFKGGDVALLSHQQKIELIGMVYCY